MSELEVLLERERKSMEWLTRRLLSIAEAAGLDGEATALDVAERVRQLRCAARRQARFEPAAKRWWAEIKIARQEWDRKTDEVVDAYRAMRTAEQDRDTLRLGLEWIASAGPDKYQAEEVAIATLARAPSDATDNGLVVVRQEPFIPGEDPKPGEPLYWFVYVDGRNAVACFSDRAESVAHAETAQQAYQLGRRAGLSVGERAWQQGYLAGRKEEAEARDTCVVCEACLVPPDDPPHCFDCHVDEELEYQWRKAKRQRENGR